MVCSAMLWFAYCEQVNKLAGQTFMLGVGAVMSVGFL